jgi:RsiW-degrading membrane proteinase PrsW (M82 family)
MDKLALALAPVVFLFSYVYVKDKYDKEPLRYLVITFIFGMLTAFPIIIGEEYLAELTETDMASSPLRLIIYAFIVVAGTEELMKYAVLRFYNYPHKEFDEPYDGIMYGVAVSLGFAAIENILYTFNYGYQTGILRMFTAVPAHAMFGIMMGYFVGRAKFMQSGFRAFLERMKGLGVAVLFHGVYDYFLFVQGYEWLAALAFVSLALGLVLARRAMRLHEEISPHKVEALIPPDYDEDEKPL